MAFFCMRTAALLALPLATTACLGAELDPASDEMLEESQDALLVGNGYLLNAINPNAINPNSLSPSALSGKALSPSALAPSTFAAITDPGASGAAARMLVRYTVSCALRPNQSFAFSWTDSDGVVHAETYHGDLGIAYWWAYNPLSDPFYQKQITACIAARSNRYGTSVMVSLRNAENSMQTDAAERATYTVREGAFWGNLFTSSPFVRACYETSGETRARELSRDCAAGRLIVDPVTGVQTREQCGPIVIEGPCNTVCNWTDPVSGYYKGCLENSANSPWIRTDVVVTSFLTP